MNGCLNRKAPNGVHLKCKENILMANILIMRIQLGSHKFRSQKGNATYYNSYNNCEETTNQSIVLVTDVVHMLLGDKGTYKHAQMR